MTEFNESEKISTNATVPADLQNCSGPLPSAIVRIATYSVLMFFSLVGNVLIVAVFHRNKSLRTPVHCFIVNLAISDLMIPLIVLPWTMSYSFLDGLWLVDGVLGTSLCKLVLIAWDLSINVSILTMLAIAADRFHAIVFVLKPALITQKSCYLLILIFWIASIAFLAHFFYAVKLFRYDSGLFCEFRWDPPSDTEEALKISWVVFLCLSTLSAIAQTVMYASIIVFLYRHKDNRHLASEITLRQARTNRKVSSMLVSVVMVFYSVWIPYHVERFIHFFRPNIKVSCVFFWTTNIFLNLLYPSVNPVIYYVFNEKYRHGFQELLRCHWSCSDTCGDCLHTSEISHSENNAPADAAQMSDGVENTKL